MSTKNDFNDNSAIVYEGPSMLDGAPIIVIVTGLTQDSENDKTGGTLQTWIMRADMDPMEAIRRGADISICGNCKHRGPVAAIVAAGLDPTVTYGKGRSCYVNIGQAPLNVWRTAQKGRYERKAPKGLGTGRKIRVGSYGDPAAAPLWVWEDLHHGATKITPGYSHQWRDFPELAPYCMASVDSLSEYAAAKLLGFRAFRVSIDDFKLPTETGCPAAAENGKRTTCDRCGLCSGTKIVAKDIVIQAHGTAGAMGNATRNLAA